MLLYTAPTAPTQPLLVSHKPKLIRVQSSRLVVRVLGGLTSLGINGLGMSGQYQNKGLWKITCHVRISLFEPYALHVI